MVLERRLFQNLETNEYRFHHFITILYFFIQYGSVIVVKETAIKQTNHLGKCMTYFAINIRFNTFHLKHAKDNFIFEVMD